jgi:hypothetical protein
MDPNKSLNDRSTIVNFTKLSLKMMIVGRVFRGKIISRKKVKSKRIVKTQESSLIIFES